MEYKTRLTDEMSYDVNETCHYINTKFQIINASDRLREKISLKVLLLEHMPRMFPAIEKYDRVKRQYRKAVINNYIMLYTIDDDNMVYISHLYYDGRDYLNQLL